MFIFQFINVITMNRILYDNPKYSISVVIEHGGSGSSSAAPIAKEVIKKVIERHEVRQAQINNIGEEI